jgi:hypothetical protein
MGKKRIWDSEVKGLGLLSESQFFQALSEASGYMDVGSAKKVYIALLAIIHRELRTKGAIRLPNLLDINVLTVNERIMTKYGRKNHKEVRARISRGLHDYFKELEELSPGTLVSVDDRVKALVS